MRFPFSPHLPKWLFLSLCSCLLVTPHSGAPASEGVSRRMADLRKEIARHDALYFREAAPEISDAEYDALVSELENLQAAWPDLVTETLPVADDRTGRFPEAGHREPMLSLRKAWSHADLAAFQEAAVEASMDGLPRFSVEPKIDGMAISLIYERGRFVRAVSRGDGRTGEDLTENLLAVGGIPRVLETGGDGAPVPDFLELRAEVFLPVDTFMELNKARVGRGLEPFSTPRNVAAGSLRLADPAEVARRGLRVACHGHGSWEPRETRPSSHAGFLERLARWKVPVVEPVFSIDAPGLSESVARLEELLESSHLPVDGVVVKADSQLVRAAMGMGSRYPNWAIACKFHAERVRTRLLGVRYNVGRTGRITPVADLAPVVASGRTITRASLHHPARIQELDLHEGDWVILKLSGNLIPGIERVLPGLRVEGAQRLAVPGNCPSCRTRLVAEEGGSALWCPDTDCPEQVVRRILHFTRSTGMRGIGPSAIRRLVEAGLLNGIAGLLDLEGRSGQVGELIGQDAADRLFEHVESLDRVPLWRVLEGLGIPEVGPSTAFRLARRLPSLESLVDGSIDMERLLDWGISRHVSVSIIDTIATREDLLRRLAEKGPGGDGSGH